MENLKLKKIIGLLIILAIIAGLFILTAIDKGVAEAALVWVIAIVLSVVVIFAVELITE